MGDSPGCWQGTRLRTLGDVTDAGPSRAGRHLRQVPSIGPCPGQMNPSGTCPTFPCKCTPALRLYVLQGGGCAGVPSPPRANPLTCSCSPPLPTCALAGCIALRKSPTWYAGANAQGVHAPWFLCALVLANLLLLCDCEPRASLGYGPPSFLQQHHVNPTNAWSISFASTDLDKIQEYTIDRE